MQSIVDSDLVTVLSEFPIIVNAYSSQDMYLNITPPQKQNFAPQARFVTNCEHAEQIISLACKVQMALIEVTPKVIELGDFSSSKKEMDCHTIG